MIPIADQIKCATRELTIRRNVYPGWVKRKRMSQGLADKEISGMQDILVTLSKVEEIDSFIRKVGQLEITDQDDEQTRDNELAQLIQELVGLKGEDDT